MKYLSCFIKVGRRSQERRNREERHSVYTSGGGLRCRITGHITRKDKKFLTVGVLFRNTSLGDYYNDYFAPCPFFKSIKIILGYTTNVH